MDLDIRDAVAVRRQRESAQFEPNQVVGLGTIVSKDGSVYAGTPNTVWIKTDDGVTAALLPLGQDTKPVAGTPVRFARDPKNTDPLKITGVNTDAANAYTSSQYSDSQAIPHWFSQHYINGEIIGSDAGLIHPRMIEQGRVTPIGGFEVGISPFVLYRAGVRWPVPGHSFDLTTDKPLVNGQKRWVTLYVDPATREYGKVAGTLYSGTNKPPYPDVPAGVLVLGSIPLSYSTSEITEQGIEEGKTPFHIPAPTSLPLDPTIDWANLVSGEILWYDQVNAYFTVMGLTAPPTAGQVISWNGLKPEYKFISEVENMAYGATSDPVTVTLSSGSQNLIPALAGKRAYIGSLALAVTQGKMKFTLLHTDDTAFWAQTELEKSGGFVLNPAKGVLGTALGKGLKISVANGTGSATAYPVTVMLSYYYGD